MFAQPILVSVLLALGASAQRFGCGTAEPDAEHIGMSKVLAAQEARQDFNLTERATINVGVYFHVVASAQTAAGGWVTDTQIANQLAVLNADFAPHDIAFNFLGTDRTVNSGWAQDSNELAMKTALRKGTYRNLNIYLQPRLSQNALGYAYFPTSVTTGSSAYYRDGVSIKSTTVPGGSQTGFNLGKTGTHEVGHWLGLYHTFQGGCTGNGDFISDTPAQASFSSGCPIGRDSCPSQAGLDPIHNYMDYSDDACYEEFTPLQKARMFSFWNTYRA
ncbi:extracellular metalloprotease [Plectosphaerella cucumerina]|uniref:Extracellular metalloprotease n=1 Tax=Plectosphaerella cucumerina TaxID=40658 RepID=A0A8K0X4C4_9PEZI|nr:extracellular metalloprotease [Plectosphaerella cucumerina]